MVQTSRHPGLFPCMCTRRTRPENSCTCTCTSEIFIAFLEVSCGPYDRKSGTAMAVAVVAAATALTWHAFIRSRAIFRDDTQQEWRYGQYCRQTGRENWERKLTAKWRANITVYSGPFIFSLAITLNGECNHGFLADINGNQHTATQHMQSELSKTSVMIFFGQLLLNYTAS